MRSIKRPEKSLIKAKQPDDNCLKESFWNLVQETKLRTNKYM